MAHSRPQLPGVAWVRDVVAVGDVILVLLEGYTAWHDGQCAAGLGGGGGV